MRNVQNILSNINKKRMKRLSEESSCDYDKLGILTGLAQLVCEELNRLFTIDPLSLCPTGITENLDKFWAIHKSLLLYDWVAEYQPQELIDEIHSLFTVRKNERAFQVRLTLIDDISAVRHAGVSFNASDEPLIMAESAYFMDNHNPVGDVLIVYYTMNERNCHEGLSLKLYRAMTIFNITKLTVPAH